LKVYQGFFRIISMLDSICIFRGKELSLYTQRRLSWDQRQSYFVKEINGARRRLTGLRSFSRGYNATHGSILGALLEKGKRTKPMGKQDPAKDLKRGEHVAVLVMVSAIQFRIPRTCPSKLERDAQITLRELEGC